MKNNQKILIGISVIFGVVLISGCLIDNIKPIDINKYPEIKPGPETDALKVCNMIKELKMCNLVKDNETGALRAAKGEKNCIVHKDKDYLGGEWNECIAIITLNESLCRSNSSYCNLQIARLKKDPEICKSVENYDEWDTNVYGIHHRENWCYLEVAKTLKGEGVCENIVIDKDPDKSDKRDIELDGKQVKAECLAYAKDEPELCEDIPSGRWGSDKDNCYEYFARKKGDVGLCDKSTNREYCYFLVAVETNDIELCKNYKMGILRDKCLAALKNPKWCDEYIDARDDDSSAYTRQECYRHIAKIRKEPNLCESADCYTYIAYEIAYDEPFY